MSPLESSRAPAPPRPVLMIVAAVAVLAGSWITFHYARAAWTLDPDTAVPVALWEGVRDHGLGFLTTWRHTPDNWLFSLLPLTSLAFEAFGAGPQVVAGIGWAIFVASVLMTALLAGKAAGPRAGFLLAAALSFASFEALGNVGYLAHPVTHNISMAWALVILLTALRAVQRRQAWAAALIGLMVFGNMISDPWAGAAIAGPLFLTAAGIAVARRGEPEAKGAAAVAAATLIGAILAATRAFGLLAFLVRHEFAFGGLHAVPSNAYWALRALGQMFNFVLFGDPDARAVKIVNAAILILLLGASAGRCLWLIGKASVRWQLVVGVALLSIGAVSAAFVIGVWPAGVNVGRFFANLYFFGPLLVTIAAASLAGARRRRWALAAVATCAGLFVASAAAGRADLWLYPTPPAGPKKARALAEFLAGKGLTYGYGPYWGADALVVEALTGGRVKIRPVTFVGGRVARRPAETSAYWYRAEDEPTGDPRRFLIIRDDGEECPSFEACHDAAVRQFGPPEATLYYRDMLVLVWPRSLAGQISSGG